MFRRSALAAALCLILLLSAGCGDTGNINGADDPGIQSGQENQETKKTDESSKQEAEEKARLEALEADRAKGLLILVNKQHEIGRDDVPGDLTDIKYFAADRTPAGRYMRAEAADAFHRLSEAAKAEEGYEIVVTTAYRSYDFQNTLYTNYVAAHGQAEADTFSAQPGKSEHQTGLAADVSSPSVNYQLTKDYIHTDEGKWLNDNAHRFGFIIRFPDGKEDITGYMYEPWHIRYVGKTAAEEIYEQGITLEEYLTESEK